MAHAYYNEIDPKAAATLRELIKLNLIAPGDVDERSIEDVLPRELAGYSQCHFFAGFGIWSYALRLAGWPDDREVWTGSCPCQPFSAAGKQGGFTDERHLWPAFFHLIQNGKRSNIPIYGEQVASPDALAWLDLVQTDLEAEGHTVRAFDLCAAGFGAPIIRQRLFWMACSGSSRRQFLPTRPGSYGTGSEPPERLLQSRRADLNSCGVAVPNGGDGSDRELQRSREHGFESEDGSTFSGMGSADDSRLEGWCGLPKPTNQISVGTPSPLGVPDWPGATNGFWQVADWLLCRDERWRAVEPGTFPLAHGYPSRMGILRGAGNAISPEVAKAFIEVTMEYA
jgi:DNA (cytosine-5)-methyltransferase 1